MEGANVIVSIWTGITQIATDDSHTVGLKTDGTMVAVGCNEHGQCNVSTWSGINQISACGEHTVGLKSDGIVVAVGPNFTISAMDNSNNISAAKVAIMVPHDKKK